jgi:hypothetical protein
MTFITPILSFYAQRQGLGRQRCPRTYYGKWKKTNE